MYRQIKDIIEKKRITTVFQPIFNVERQDIVGYEALTRGPEGTDFYSPEVLFNVATENGLLSDLEILCRNNAISVFSQLGLQGKLFLNVSPMVLLNHDHPQGETVRMVRASGLSCQQIVIEISEKYPIPSTNILHKAIAKYREFGFEVAIDDLGAGYSGLKQWSFLRPDIVKIDRYFIANCHEDIVKKEFLRTIFELGRSTNAQVIAEGIENQQEFALLCELGLTYAQGFYLAKPEKQPALQYPAWLKPLSVLKSPMLTNQHLGSVASLVVNAKTIADGDKVEKAYQLFAQNTGLMCLPVIKNNRPIGIIYRELLMEYFSDIYGRALYGKKLVTEVMEPNPITIEQTLLLDEASIYITQVKDTEFSRYFIVVDQGYYLGLASIRELLRRITEAKIENARYANPLTLLPGNVPIDKEIDYLLSVGQSFYFAYIDINHFKPFNDVYGYAQGDLMLKQLARIIQNNCHDIDSFIGHVGGDDFVAIIKSEQVLAVCEMIVQAFNEQIRGFYSQQHLNDSGYYALSRNGEQVFYPLVSLAIGIIQPDVSRCLTHHEVATMATEAKAEAKKIEGGGVFECRRRSTQQGDWWVSETNEQTAVA